MKGHETKTRGLGRGFDALIPQNFDNSLLLSEEERVQKIAVERITPHSGQPRQQFDETALLELAESIKAHGILQPLVVTPASDETDTYQIVAGERRWRAAQLAGLKSVPVIVRTLKELQRLEIALVENVQRVDLSPLEQAISIERLHQQFNVSYETIAKRLGKASSTITNIVRLLQLPPDAQEALRQQRITEGHARAILALREHPNHQKLLLKAIQSHGWTVRQAERYVISVREGVAETKKVRERVATETPETKRLSKRLGTPVHVKRMAKGGRLEITFHDDDELNSILLRLR